MSGHYMVAREQSDGTKAWVCLDCGYCEPFGYRPSPVACRRGRFA